MSGMHKFMTQRTFLKKAGNDAILWVKPSKIQLFYGTKRPNTKRIEKKISEIFPSKLQTLSSRLIILLLNSYIIRENNISAIEQIDELEKYNKIQNFIQNIDNFERSKWFLDLEKELKDVGHTNHKKIRMNSKEDIINFLRYYKNDVVLSMKKNGFLESYTGFESTAIINEEGRIVKTGSGNHRFFVARVLNLETFPLKICGVHEKWFQKLIEVRGRPTIKTVIDGLREVEC